MTLPTLVQNYQERATVSKVKKFYSMMSQALLMAIKDNGEINEWSISQQDEDENIMLADKFVSYLKPYLKITKDCGTDSGCIANEYFTLKGTAWTDVDGHANYDTSKLYYKMILADGSSIWFRYSSVNESTVCKGTDSGISDVCSLVWYDINGKLPPNAFGKDTFYFIIQKNRIISPNLDDCNINDDGWSCSKNILQNDNMDYLKN